MSPFSSRPLLAVFTTLLAFCSLSPNLVADRASRHLAACVDPVADLFPNEDLFSQIQDETLRKSSLDYYQFLSRVEAQALLSREMTLGIYGQSSLFSTAQAFRVPSVQPFDLGRNPYAATGFLGNALNPTVQPQLALSAANLSGVARPVSATSLEMVSPNPSISMPSFP